MVIEDLCLSCFTNSKDEFFSKTLPTLNILTNNLDDSEEITPEFWGAWFGLLKNLAVISGPDWSSKVSDIIISQMEKVIKIASKSNDGDLAEEMFDKVFCPIVSLFTVLDLSHLN